MTLALLTVDLQFFEARSLKDKRGILSRLKNDLRREFNVSFAELDHQDAWQRSRVGLAFLCPAAPAAEEQARAILQFLENRFNGQVTGHALETF